VVGTEQNPVGEGTGLDDIGAGALEAGSDVVEGAVDAAPDDPLDTGADFVGDSFGVATDVTGDVFSGTADFIGNNPVSDTVVEAGDLIGDAEEALGEPITGPPGMVESTLGSVGSDIAEASQDAAGFANENVVDPYADIVATTAEDISRGEVPTIEDFQDEPETTPGQAVDALFTGAGEEVAGFTVGLPNALYQGVEGAGDAAEFTFSNIEQEGLAEGISETGRATADFTSQLGGVAYQEFRENPIESVGRLAGGLAAGSALAKGLEKGTDIARGLNVKRQGDTPEIPFEDITTEAGLRGSLPDFTTDPDAPTSEAVDEIRRRARANPDEIIPGESEGAIFHTTGDRLGPDLEVGEGRSELPGLFGSPEASPIGLERIGGRGYDLSLRLPDLRPDSDRIVTLPGDDIEGMPDWARGAGYELRTPEGDVDVRGLTRGQAKARAEGTDLEVRPQSDLPGYQYLTEEAPPGTFQVRPQGSRTTELEAITPPGGRFIEEGVTPVRLGGIDIPFTDTRIPGTGRVVPARRFTRADTDADVDTPSGTGTGAVDDTSALSLPTSQLSRRSGTPVGPPLFGTSTPGAGSQPGVFGQETIPGESTTGTGGTGSGTTGGSDVFGNLISDVSGLTGGSGSFFDGFGLEPTPTGTGTNTDGGVTDPTRGTTDPSRTRGSTGTGTGTNGGGTGGSSGPGGTGGPFGPIDFTGSGGGSDGPPSGGSPPTGNGSPPGSGPPTGTPPSGGSGTPGSPTGSPPGTPTPSGIFGFGAGTPAPTETQPRLPFDLNTDDDRDEFPEVPPQGQEFENPLVSGRSFILGGTTTGQPQDGANGLFSGGVDTDASGSLFGFDRDDGPAADPFGMGEFFNG
jgi:hypothetical protein